MDLFFRKIDAKNYIDLKNKINIHSEGLGIKIQNDIVTGFVEKDTTDFDTLFADLCKKAELSESECKDMEKTEFYRVKQPNTKESKPFLSNYLPIVFFTIIATALGWEIAKNLNTIIYNYYLPIYGILTSNLIAMGYISLIFFLFLIIGFILYRNWKHQVKYIYFPH